MSSTEPRGMAKEEDELNLPFDLFLEVNQLLGSSFKPSDDVHENGDNRPNEEKVAVASFSRSGKKEEKEDEDQVFDQRTGQVLKRKALDGVLFYRIKWSNEETSRWIKYKDLTDEDKHGLREKPQKMNRKEEKKRKGKEEKKKKRKKDSSQTSSGDGLEDQDQDQKPETERAIEKKSKKIPFLPLLPQKVSPEKAKMKVEAEGSSSQLMFKQDNRPQTVALTPIVGKQEATESGLKEKKNEKLFWDNHLAGKEAEKVIGITDKLGLHLLVKWKGLPLKEAQLLPNYVVNVKWPDVVIAFYEARSNFVDPS